MSEPPNASKPMTPLEWGLLVALSVLWGGSFFFNGIAVKELPTFTVVTSRVALAAVILLAALRLGGTRTTTAPSLWAAFFAMGLLNNVIPFSLIVWGQSHIASGLAAILNATTPLFTVIVASLTANERLTAGRAAGVVVGLIGVAVMTGADALRSLGADVAA
jgi:drug/metabolite transporter (DMT)-like permease